MKKGVRFAMFALLAVALAPSVRSHCEIPCGIYDDQARISLMKEHIATIEKSMDQIAALSTDSVINYNQLVRWVTNKEDHAARFMDVVSQYFMTQRIKPVDPGAGSQYLDYQKKLGLLHQMLVYAMKCKQTTDKANPDKLRELVDSFAALYFGVGQ